MWNILYYIYLIVTVMKYFVDEAGCLGFKRGSTRFLTFSYVNVEDKGQVDRAVKRFQKRRRGEGRYSARELKFSESSDELRLDALSYLSRKKWTAGIIVLEKSKVKKALRTIPNILYNYTIIDALMKRVLPSFSLEDRLEICIDQRVYHAREAAFNEYACNKAWWVWNNVLCRAPSISNDHLVIQHEKSHRECCLQLADYIAGAAFHEYERGDDRYLDVIRHKVVALDYLWP